MVADYYGYDFGLWCLCWLLSVLLCWQWCLLCVLVLLLEWVFVNDGSGCV